MLTPLHDQHVLILGLGASGLAMARWCARQGAQVTVADTREQPPQLAALQADVPQALFVSGPLDGRLLSDGRVTTVFKSPGLTPASVALVMEHASNLKAENVRPTGTSGELGLFSQALADLKTLRGYSPAVLAVTGTNGKTTVTSLTGQLVERAGKTVAVAGNIGPTLLDVLTHHLDTDSLPEVWVIELSSFQLDALSRDDSFEPTAATVLNITQDHLDWHGSLQAYAVAKARVFGNTALMVMNREDPMVMAMLPAVATTGRSKDRVKDRIPQREHITFGADRPQRPGDFGIEDVNGMVWLVRAQDADETKRRRNEEAEELHIQRLMPAEALRIRGRHNAVNALASLALASAAGCALAPILFGLREYRGEPHRVQSIGIVNEIEYFDDSKGTNVGATVAALNGLGPDRKLVVILGGDGKGQDFSPLADPVQQYVRAVVLIGRDAGLIREAIQRTGVTLMDAASMDDAVTQSAAQAKAGDAVLMSPACASLDMFDNYGHRAAVFTAAVSRMAMASGVELEGAA